MNPQSKEIITFGLVFGFLYLFVRFMILGAPLHPAKAFVDMFIVIMWLASTQYIASTLSYDPIEAKYFMY